MKQSIPEVAYEGYCDNCMHPKKKMFKISFNNYDMHYCSDECRVIVEKKLSDIYEAISPKISMPELKHAEFENFLINPLADLMDQEKLEKIRQIYINYQNFIDSGMLKTSFPKTHNTALFAVANWMS